MKFVMLSCGSSPEGWAERADELYTQKISAFISFEIKDLPTKKASRDDKQTRILADSEKLLKEIKPEDFVVLFDERGKSLDSVRFSEHIGRILLSGKKRTLFIIGGAYGVDERIRARAQLQISLSSMVLNHLVARTVALEQIYRAFTILKSLPYHNS